LEEDEVTGGGVVGIGSSSDLASERVKRLARLRRTLGGLGGDDGRGEGMLDSSMDFLRSEHLPCFSKHGMQRAEAAFGLLSQERRLFTQYSHYSCVSDAKAIEDNKDVPEDHL
jgi:hypothetical protein